MARIPIWDKNSPETPGEIRESLEHVERVFGGPPFDFHRVMSNHPEMVKRFTELYMVSLGENSTITPAHRELAYTTATVINNCHY